MRLALTEEMFKLDRETSLGFGISSEQLMENAGLAIANFVASKIQLNKKIIFICGPGNNGGDGFVAARILKEKKFQNVSVIFFENKNHNDLWKNKKSQCIQVGVDAFLIDAKLNFADKIQSADVILDGIFGIGLSKSLEGEFYELANSVNISKAMKIAIDIPSGLHSDSGMILGIAIKSDYTLCCGVAKAGMFLNYGPEYCGRIKVLDIGFPKQLEKQTCRSTFLITKKFIKRIMPQRTATANKSNFGHLLVLAGSENMSGAAIMAAIAAARMGCGYVTVCSVGRLSKEKINPDFLTLKYNDFLKSDLTKYSAILAGPGLGVTSKTKKIISKIKQHQKVLLDADALTVCAKNNIYPLPAGWLLTPHAGELSKIINIPAKQIESDRIKYAQMAQNKERAIVLLKGFHTIVRNQNKNYIINSGNVALAKAGSGDVLAGFIASLMAQGVESDRAAVIGAWMHGRIADVWVKNGNSTRTLMASDLPKLLGKVLQEIEE